MRLIVDGDACPVKDLLLRVAQRLDVPLLLVSNKPMGFGREPGVTPVIVPAGADEADRWIAEEVGPEDLVITADIPLAARVVEKGATAIGHRGEIFDEASIGERLATWAFLKTMREGGLETGGPKPFDNKDRAAFASALDRWLTKRRR
ncbi:hypothetical protein D3C72_754710 [compost metagenome]